MWLNLFCVSILLVSVGLPFRCTVKLSYGHAKREADFAAREIKIAENYIEGLKILSVKYDDDYLLTFVADFKKSGAYIEAFGKSAQLAELRNVPANRVLKSKADIDRYFGGK